MPPYKEQGIVLRSVKLGEADKIVTVLTQGSGKVRAVAKGVRKTTSRFGARVEPFTHVNLMLYRGRGSLDTVTQAEILAPHLNIRTDLSLFAAGETMLEAVDKVAEEHEKNVRLVLLLLSGLRALDARPGDPAAVAESFLLKLLSLSGFHPSRATYAYGPVGWVAPSVRTTPTRGPARSRRRHSRCWLRSRRSISPTRVRAWRVTSGSVAKLDRCCSGSPNTTSKGA
jgi:hypothetical protein